MSDSNNNNNNSDVAVALYEEEYHPPFLPALILFPPIAPCFWNYRIRVSNERLDVGYSMYFHHEIDRDLIERAEVIDHINGLTDGWGGWGYRKNTRWETGYITKNGPGIKLTYKTTSSKGTNGKENVVVFNCNEAEKVCNILNTPVLNAVVH